MGGPSEEREVSLSTGMAVIDACQKIGYKPTKISFEQDYKSYLSKMKKQDIIFNALHGGIGENGKIQAWKDNYQIKYTCVRYLRERVNKTTGLLIYNFGF